MLLRDNGVDLGVFLPGFDRVKAVSQLEEERLMPLLMPWELSGSKDEDISAVDTDDEDELSIPIRDKLKISSRHDEV